MNRLTLVAVVALLSGCYQLATDSNGKTIRVNKLTGSTCTVYIQQGKRAAEMMSNSCDYDAEKAAEYRRKDEEERLARLAAETPEERAEREHRERALRGHIRRQF